MIFTSASRSTPVALPTMSACASVLALRRGDRVVDELDGLALPELADVHDELAHDLEQRPGALEVRLGPAGHDRRASRPRPSGDEPVTGASTKPMPRSSSAAPIGASCARRDRRHVDAQRALARPRRDAVVAEQDRLDLRRRQRPS
jgi:hypothetical protein